MRRFLRLLTPAVADICLPDARGAVLAQLHDQPAVAAAATDDLEVRWQTGPSPDYDALWVQFRTRFAIAIDKTASYLHYRYVEAPILRYRFLDIRRRGRLISQLVARAQVTPAGEFYRIASGDGLYEILARRVIDWLWFPSCFRPGFHTERPDSHLFLEQFIPFDYANQACGDDGGAFSDTAGGRYGDWRRATRSWHPYQP